MDELRLNPVYYTAEHLALRESLRRFVAAEITPHAAAWDEAGGFPRELYARAADVGLLGLGFPEEYGGLPGVDYFHRLVASLELAQAGSGGVVASLMSHTIGSPPVAALGSAELKQRVLPEVLAGRRIAALAITEPSGGSDVAALRTTAVRDGDHYVLRGEKTFITSGLRADYLTVAARTDPTARGARGLSLLLVEGDTPGLTRTPLAKMGWWASDTAHLHFDGCRVPAANLIGPENSGFLAIMLNFNAERFALAASAVGFAWVCYQEALAWARERHTFGQPLMAQQVIRQKIVRMIDAVLPLQAWLVQLSQRIDAGEQPVAEISLAKNLGGRVMRDCADDAVQILGGAGFMRGGRVERIYREVKVMMIGGGAEEILNDLAAKQLGLI